MKLKRTRELLRDFQEGAQLHMITGFCMCRCGWRSETVGGVIEQPSYQPHNLRDMIGKIKHETKLDLLAHKEDTGHDAKMFFMS